MTEPLIDVGPAVKPVSALPDRRVLDKYRTPAWVTAALIESYPEIRGDLLLDPCAGDCRMSGSLLRAGRFELAITNDIDAAEPTDEHEDATRDDLWKWWHREVAISRRCFVISNTPFDVATPIVWRAIQAAKNCAFLLRATWLEPWEDRQWLGRLPPRAELVLPRFSFTGSGSDTSGCRWYIWGDVEPGIKVWVGKPGQLELGATP